jgi:hypothetical protein
MKRGILFFVVVFCSCSKSMTDNQQIGKAEERIVGKWKLIQFYRENNNGTGEWVSVDTANVQIIQFNKDGGFIHNENFSVQQSIDRYKFLEPNKILLYSSTSSDSAKYFYKQDQFPELLFNPMCMEYSCMRKWGRLE